MWNQLKPALDGAGGGARPSMPGPGAPQPAAAAPPQPGMPPAPGGAPPAGPQMPAEFQQHIDPNNHIQATLIQRGHQLTPQESQAFAAGVSVAALAVLKKLVPELGFLWDKIIQTKQSGGGAPGGAPPTPGQPPAPGAMPPQPAQRLSAQNFQQ